MLKVSTSKAFQKWMFKKILGGVAVIKVPVHPGTFFTDRTPNNASEHPFLDMKGLCAVFIIIALSLTPPKNFFNGIYF